MGWGEEDHNDRTIRWGGVVMTDQEMTDDREMTDREMTVCTSLLRNDPSLVLRKLAKIRSFVTEIA